MVWDICLFTWGDLSPRYALTDSCAPSVYIFGGGWETENALTQNKYCSAIAKVFVCYQHFVSSQMQTIGPHNLLWRKVTLFHPKPVHKHNPQRSRSGSIPFLNFLTLGIQKDVHSSTEILMGGIMYMQVSGFHFMLCCEPRTHGRLESAPSEARDWWYQLLLSYYQLLNFCLGVGGR